MLSASRRVVAAIAGTERPSPRSLVAVVADDQAAGHPVPRPVRGLVLGDRYGGRLARRRPGSATARAGSRSAVVLWLPFLPRAARASYLAQPRASTRTRSSTSSRCGPGTRGGCSRSWPRAAGSSATTSRSSGPFTFRHIGYLVTAILSVRHRGWRSCATRARRTFVLGLAASVLTFFTFMTQMHERYAYAAVVVARAAHPGPAHPLARGDPRGRHHAQPRSRPCRRRRGSGPRCRSAERWGSSGRLAVVALSVLSLLWLRRDAADRPLAQPVASADRAALSPQLAPSAAGGHRSACFAASPITTTGAINGTGTASKAVTTSCWRSRRSAIEL